MYGARGKSLGKKRGSVAVALSEYLLTTEDTNTKQMVSQAVHRAGLL